MGRGWYFLMDEDKLQIGNIGKHVSRSLVMRACSCWGVRVAGRQG